MSDVKHTPGNCTCPKCGENFRVALTHHVPDSQTISERLTLTSQYISAKVLGGHICAFEKLMTAVTKQCGEKVMVSVVSISMQENVIEIQYLITKAKGQP